MYTFQRSVVLPKFHIPTLNGICVGSTAEVNVVTLLVLSVIVKLKMKLWRHFCIKFHETWKLVRKLLVVHTLAVIP